MKNGFKGRTRKEKKAYKLPHDCIAFHLNRRNLDIDIITRDRFRIDNGFRQEFNLHEQSKVKNSNVRSPQEKDLCATFELPKSGLKP